MNTLIMIVFFLLSALMLGAAIMVVTVKNIIHSALWLITSFFGVGALYASSRQFGPKRLWVVLVYGR